MRHYGLGWANNDILEVREDVVVVYNWIIVLDNSKSTYSFHRWFIILILILTNNRLFLI
jgi:hypothetical protein